ncbi:hypothetical protein DO71_4686 [Burkholderia pseudomallei]|nr:hypothetical protein DO71_4686 [Burkholderia pseudomallei]
MIRRAGAHSAAAVSFLHVVAASAARCTASRTAGIPPEKTGRPARRETPVYSYVINSKKLSFTKTKLSLDFHRRPRPLPVRRLFRRPQQLDFPCPRCPIPPAAMP